MSDGLNDSRELPKAAKARSSVPHLEQENLVGIISDAGSQGSEPARDGDPSFPSAARAGSTVAPAPPPSQPQRGRADAGEDFTSPLTVQQPGNLLHSPATDSSNPSDNSSTLSSSAVYRAARKATGAFGGSSITPTTTAPTAGASQGGPLSSGTSHAATAASSPHSDDARTAGRSWAATVATADDEGEDREGEGDSGDEFIDGYDDDEDEDGRERERERGARRARGGRKKSSNTSSRSGKRSTDAGGGGDSSSSNNGGFSSSTREGRTIKSFRGNAMPEYQRSLPRVGHTGLLYDRDFYVFGGVNQKGQYPNKLFRHVKRSLQWEDVRTLGPVPGGRAHHTAVLAGSRMIIFGGHHNLEPYDDMYSFNFDSSRWERIYFERAQGPGPLFLHAAVHVPARDGIMVLGGFHQREHNVYIGHLFDLHNRVWSGLTCPATVNPQHIQLVTACYLEKRASIAVLGLVEADTAAAATRAARHPRYATAAALSPPPFLYLMNVHSYVWTRVETTKSPESPVPFRLDAAWEELMRQLISMGGVFEEHQQAWLFPVNIENLAGVGAAGGGGGGGSSGSSSNGGRRARRPQYGFLKLQLNDLSWSLLLASFPKKMLKEIAQRNRERANRNVKIRRTTAEDAATARLRYSIAESLRTQRQSVGAALASITLGSMTVLNELFNELEGSAGTVGSSSLLPPLNASGGEAAGAGGGAAALKSAELQQEMVFTVRGALQLEHKYVYGVYRDQPATSGADGREVLKPPHYIIMHGGLVPGENYAMLTFTPVFARPDAYTARAVFASTNAEDSVAEMSWYDAGAEYDDDGDSSSIAGPSRGLSLGGGGGGDDGDSASVMDPALGAERAGCLLPLLPCERTAENRARFGMMLHVNNGLRLADQPGVPLSAPNTQLPVAVMEDEAAVRHWSQNYYRNQRRWMAERLRVAFKDDKKLKRLRTSPSPSAFAALGNDAGDVSTDDDDDDGGNGAPPAAVPKTFTPAGGRDAAQRRTLHQARRSTIVAAETAFERRPTITGRKSTGGDGASFPDPAEEREVPDFFESKKLEVFDVAVLTMEEERGSDEDDGDDRNSSAAASARASSVAAARLPPGLERLWMKVKRHHEVQRLPPTVFQRGLQDGNAGDLGSAMSYVLMRNAINNLRQDGSAQFRSARARIRWRFLRALVLTGEAAFIIYRTAQEETRMQGVPVSSVPGLLLTPELHLVGPTRPFKVPNRPVPYALAHPPRQAARYAELTKTGMAVYHNMRHLK